MDATAPTPVTGSGPWASTLGCVLPVTLVLLYLIHQAGPQRLAWLLGNPAPASTSAPAGRYQLVSGKTRAFVYDAHPEDAVFKVDTQTGQTWIFHPMEFAPAGTLNPLADRWQEINSP